MGKIEIKEEFRLWYQIGYSEGHVHGVLCGAAVATVFFLGVCLWVF